MAANEEGRARMVESLSARRAKVQWASLASSGERSTPRALFLGAATLAIVRPMPPAIEPDPLASVRAGYDRWAEVYDHDRNPLPALEEPEVKAAVGDVRDRDVLDLGCGTGRHASWMAAAGARVTAIDFSEGMLALARQKPGGEAIRFLVHDLHQPIPIANGAFDVVVSGLVVEHIADLPRFFGEARRVLRPGGLAVISALHPAMFLRGSQARFTDPASNEIVHVGSVAHRLGDFVMAAVGAGFAIEGIGEHAPDAAFAAEYPRAEKYIGWPMLAVLKLRAPR